MIICNCNAISDRDIKRVAQQGNGSIKACFTALDKKPNCGRCFSSINKIIEKVDAEYKHDAKVKKSVA